MKTVLDTNKLKLLFSPAGDDEHQIETNIGSLLEGGTPIDEDGDDMHFVAAVWEGNHYYCWRMKDYDGTLMEPDSDNEQTNRLCQLRFDSVAEAMEAVANGDWGIHPKDVRCFVIVRIIEEDMGNPF